VVRNEHTSPTAYYNYFQLFLLLLYNVYILFHYHNPQSNLIIALYAKVMNNPHSVHFTLHVPKLVILMHMF
jgi:hypothetical protein